MRVLDLAVVSSWLGLLVAPLEVAKAEPGLREAGRTIVAAHCARCHAIDLEDASPYVAAPPFRTVVTRYPVENLAEALAEGIVSGHPDMPEFVFAPSDIKAILAYLESLKNPRN